MNIGLEMLLEQGALIRDIMIRNELSHYNDNDLVNDQSRDTSPVYFPPSPPKTFGTQAGFSLSSTNRPVATVQNRNPNECTRTLPVTFIYNRDMVSSERKESNCTDGCSTSASSSTSSGAEVTDDSDNKADTVVTSNLQSSSTSTTVNPTAVETVSSTTGEPTQFSAHSVEIEQGEVDRSASSPVSSRTRYAAKRRDSIKKTDPATTCNSSRHHASSISSNIEYAASQTNSSREVSCIDNSIPEASRKRQIETEEQKPYTFSEEASRAKIMKTARNTTIEVPDSSYKRTVNYVNAGFWELPPDVLRRALMDFIEKRRKNTITLD